jgi:hypothetical protein
VTVREIIKILDDLAQPDLNVIQSTSVGAYRVVAVSDDGVHRSCVVRSGRFRPATTWRASPTVRTLWAREDVRIPILNANQRGGANNAARPDPGTCETILPVVFPTHLARVRCSILNIRRAAALQKRKRCLPWTTTPLFTRSPNPRPNIT